MDRTVIVKKPEATHIDSVDLKETMIKRILTLKDELSFTGNLDNAIMEPVTKEESSLGTGSFAL